MTRAHTDPGSPAEAHQVQEADQPPEVTVILPKGPALLTQPAAKTLPAFRHSPGVRSMPMQQSVHRSVSQINRSVFRAEVVPADPRGVEPEPPPPRRRRHRRLR
jgi:hypothetical protein